MEQKASIVRSQIIPLTDMNLVLPNTCIAEVINYSEPMPVDNAPDWFLGNLLWRGITIPVVSFEAANEVPSAGISKATRIAVLNGVSGNEKLSFYGVVVQGIPRLAALEQEEIQEKVNSDVTLPYALSQTEIADQDAVIPDQVKIEQLLKKAGAQTGGIY